MERSRLRAICALALLLSFMSTNTYPFERPSAVTADGGGVALTATGRVFPESLEGTSRMRMDQNGNTYVLNAKDSSIRVYDRSFKFVRRIGSLGQGPDDLRHPSDFAVDRSGQLIIADTDNNRIQIMSPSGKSLRAIKFRQPYSVDVLSTGEIVATSRQDRELIRLISREGVQLANIGEPVSTGYEESFLELHVAINRGSLLVDDHDYIYWIGNSVPTPTVRKYSRDGKLLLEFHPGGRALSAEAEVARERLRQSYEAHIAKMNVVLHTVRVNPKTGDIWVLPAAPRLDIYDSNGNLKQEFQLRSDRPIGGRDIMILNDGRFILANFIDGGYLFKEPKDLNSNSAAKRRSR